jgi:Fe2+ transport system protein B
MNESRLEFLRNEFLRGMIANLLTIALFITIIFAIIYLLYKMAKYFNAKEESRDNYALHRNHDFEPISTKSNPRRQEIVKKIVAKDREFIDIENYEGTEEIVQQNQVREESFLKKLSRVILETIFYGFITFVTSFFVIFIIVILLVFILNSVLGITMLGIMSAFK